MYEPRNNGFKYIPTLNRMEINSFNTAMAYETRALKQQTLMTPPRMNSPGSIYVWIVRMKLNREAY